MHIHTTSNTIHNDLLSKAVFQSEVVVVHTCSYLQYLEDSGRRILRFRPTSASGQRQLCSKILF